MLPHISLEFCCTRIPVTSADIFLPLPDGLLVNLSSSKDLVEQLLDKLPTYYEDESYRDDGSAAGAAMQAGLKLLVSILLSIATPVCL